MDCFDALMACFPAGTVSGAPKVRAMEIIEEFEKTRRGIYAGGILYLDFAGNLDSCIALRTMVIKNGLAYVQAGGGIVADSTADGEFHESVNKAKALLRALEAAHAAGGRKGETEAVILLLDNYDSFTYNLAQYLGELGCQLEVHRNDKISVEDIARRKPEAIVISPGPCTPQEAGICSRADRESLRENFRSWECAWDIKPWARRLEERSFARRSCFTARPAKSSTTERHFSQTDESVRGNALSFADCRAQVAAQGFDHHRGDPRRHHHGNAAQTI